MESFLIGSQGQCALRPRTILLSLILASVGPSRSNKFVCEKLTWVDAGYRISRHSGAKSYARLQGKMSCTFARFHCGTLGGSLPIATDREVYLFLDSIFNQTVNNHLLHLGVTRKFDQDLNQWNYTWDDGRRISKMDHVVWKQGEPGPDNKEETCVMIDLLDNYSWSAGLPDSMADTLCQAQYPCSPRPFLTVNQTAAKLENKVLTFVEETTAVVECKIGGDNSFLKDYALNCTSMNGSASRVLTTVIHLRFPGPELCVCKARYWQEKTLMIRESYILFQYEFLLKFLGNIPVNVTIISSPNSISERNVDIASRPRPVGYNMTVNGFGVNPDNYKVTYNSHGSRESTQGTVRVQMMPSARSGMYVLVIKGFNGDCLEYPFNYIAPKRTETNNIGNYFYTIGAIFPFLLVFISFLIGWRMNRHDSILETFEDSSQGSKMNLSEISNSKDPAEQKEPSLEQSSGEADNRLDEEMNIIDDEDYHERYDSISNYQEPTSQRYDSEGNYYEPTINGTRV